MKQYKSVDLAKAISALLILIIHTAPFSSYSKILTFGFRNIIAVIAVPFFFMASGFLAFKKINSLDNEKKNSYVFSYLKRIAVMYLIWSAVYFIFVAIKWAREEFSVFNILEYVKDFFFEGSYSTIWFLPALFCATLIVYLLHKKFSYKTIFAVSCAVYVFTLLGSSYYGIAVKIPFLKTVYDLYYSFFDSIKNGVCFGMIFVCLGALMAQNEEKVTKNKSPFKAFLTVVFFYLILAVEEFSVAYFNLNSKGVDTVITLVPFTWFFFKFVLLFEVDIKDGVCIAMRKYSILMFLSQRIPLSIVEMFMSDSIIATNSLLYFLTILVSTLFISFVIIQFSKKFKVFKYAY